MKLQYYLCAQENPLKNIVVIECFETIEDAIESLDILMTELPDHNFWIGYVPSKVTFASEPVLY